MLHPQSAKGKRLFIALTIPWSPRLDEFSRDLRQFGHTARIRWVKPENFHLTLRFLGNSQPWQEQNLLATLPRIAREFPPPVIQLRGAGLFYQNLKPSVVWIGIEPHPVLTGLHSRCESLAWRLGYPENHQAFRPHVSLGRIKECPPDHAWHAWSKEQAGQEYGEFLIPGMELMESRLFPDGPQYESLGIFPFGSE